MCNLSVVWSRESLIPSEYILEFLKHGEKRGSDGWGCVEIDTNLQNNRDPIYQIDVSLYIGPESVKQGYDILDPITCRILMCNHRAAPETEPEVNIKYLDNVLQPIIYKENKNNTCLIHNGAISNFLVENMDNDQTWKRCSKLDSEVILWMYQKNNYDIKMTVQELSGGFAFILFDENKQKLYVACNHSPLYCGYLKGYGMFWNSQEKPIWELISNLKGVEVKSHNLNVFEDYYVRMIPEFTVEEIDLATGMINHISFNPRYMTQTWDPLIKTNNNINKRKVIVAASGGLDSSTTLCTLKEAGYDPIAMHFQYGHRGGKCELSSIVSIAGYLNIPLITVDIQEIKKLDNGMLTTDAEITTGTAAGLKKLDAWTTWRNGFFMSYMAAYAEKIIMEYNLSEIYITGGFMNLTESGVYPDNSERFLKSFIKFNKFASIVGNRVKPLYGLNNILKTEQYILLDRLGYYDIIGKYLISCDRPKFVDGVPCNCAKNGKPACGSGLLSYWALKMSGLEDLRNYYEIDEDYQAYEPNSTLKIKNISLRNIINKLEIHEENRNILLNKLEN